jgi:Reverse transcriptase (RNA-dependent DNA polymerase)
VLAPLLARLFKALYDEGCIPEDWKDSKISPLYKKGDVHVPSNYRMLAVSTGLYRLYANVLRNVLTEWCRVRDVVPDTQFGFYPGRSTTHAMFILRHAARAAKHKRKKLYTAFIDFTQAYDHVDRSALWGILHNMGLPDCMLKGLRSLYQGGSIHSVRWGQTHPASATCARC